MRISLDAKRAYHNRRGLGNYSRDVIRLLTTYAPENDYYLIAKPSPHYSFANTTTIEPTGIYRKMPSLYRSWGCNRVIEGMDIHMGLSGELPFGIEKATSTKKVVTVHDAIFVRYPELYSATYRWLFAKKVNYSCKVADIIIAISEQTKRDIIEFFGADENKIKVVYQGCNNIFREPVSSEADEKVKQLGLPSEYIIDVGAIEPRKNLERLIEAVKASGTGLPIVAVGGRSRYADEMAKKAENEGVRLIMLHGVDFALLPALYKNALMSVYPSIFEGFGIPILESMCIGTPVLTSTGSCFSETGGQAALYANPYDAAEIGAQIARIANDGELRKIMIESGKRQAMEFTDEKVAQSLIETIL